MSQVIEWLRGSSQYVINTIRAALLALMGFKVIDIDQTQFALVMGLAESFFATITAKTTVSHARVEVIKDKARDEGVQTGIAMASPPTTGTGIDRGTGGGTLPPAA